MAKLSINSALRCTASGMIYVAFAQPAMAQDSDFLGTIQLGESKREVLTDTAAPVTVVDQEEIDDRQAGTIAELIDSVPGVALVNGSTPQGSGINIRGYGANGQFGTDQKVSVQVDGATTGAEELYRIGNQLFTDPFLYKSVEVVRGTVGSFAYGSGIIGGVVLLETKDASDFTGGELGFNLRQTLELTSNGDNFNTSTIFAWQPSQDLEFLGNYILRQQDDQVDGDGDVIGNSAFELPTSMIKAKYTFGQNKDQTLTFSYSDTTTDETDVPYDTFMTTAGMFGNVDRVTESQTASLRYTYSPEANDLVDLAVTLSYANQKIDQQSTAGPGESPFLAAVKNADHQYETTKLNVTNTSFFTTGAVDHELVAGVEFTRKERLNASSAPGGIDNRFAVFVVDEMAIGSAFTVTPAFRYEKSRIEGSTVPNDGTYENDALMGGLSARYGFGNGAAVFASYAYTENLPILDDLGGAGFMALSPDEAMSQSEKAETYEIGASYDGFDVFQAGDTLSFKANIYQTKLWDVTSYSAGSLNRVETEGLELEASYAQENGFYLDANANFTNGKELNFDGTTQDWRNSVADSLRLTVGQKFGEELDVSWEAVSNARIDINGEETSSFVVHNLRATYLPQSGVLEGTEFRVGVENLLDRDYRPAASTRDAPGRNFKFTVARTF